METVFVIPDSLKRGARRFAHCVHTDGVSMRLGTARPTQDDTPSSAASSSSQPDKRQRVAPTELPRHGIMGTAEFAEWVKTNAECHGGDEARQRVLSLEDGALRDEAPSAQNAKLDELLNVSFGGDDACPFHIVGCDPGKQTLVQIADPTEHGLPPDERRQSGKVHTVRYTASRRRHDSQPGRYGLREKQRLAPKYAKRVKRASMAAEYRRVVVETPDAILAAERSIVANAHAEGEVVPCANGPTTARLVAWIHRRAVVLPTLRAYYEQPFQRNLRWKRHIEQERSLATFVNELGEMERKTGKQLVIAYGGWGTSAGRPGQACNKRSPPCMGVGLLRKLSMHFLCVVVPEHHTTRLT